MDKKAQVGVGWIVIAAVAVIIGVAFFSTVFQTNIGQLTRTFTSTNIATTMPASATPSELTMCGQKVVSISITNGTDGVTINAANYTISQSVGADGYLAAKIVNSTVEFDGYAINVTCTYQPKGYIADNGGRAIVGIIAIMMALLIVVAAMPNLRNGVIDFFKR